MKVPFGFLRIIMEINGKNKTIKSRNNRKFVNTKALKGTGASCLKRCFISKMIILYIFSWTLSPDKKAIVSCWDDMNRSGWDHERAWNKCVIEHYLYRRRFSASSVAFFPGKPEELQNRWQLNSQGKEGLNDSKRLDEKLFLWINNFHITLALSQLYTKTF